MRKINATFEVKNELEDYKLRVIIESLGGKHVITLLDTDHLKEDKKYKELRKQVKIAKDSLYNYVDKNRKSHE